MYKDIKIQRETNAVETQDLEDVTELTEENMEQHMEDSIAAVSAFEDTLKCCDFTSEDIEEWIRETCTTGDLERLNKAKEMKLADLRMSCVRYILPKARKAWILRALGRENIKIKMEDGSVIPYIPNTVFDKTENGNFQTITFDMAHLSNLCRESAAKGKLTNLGLNIESLKILSESKGYEYLEKIISLKNNNTLEYDPMNQKASAALFSG